MSFAPPSTVNVADVDLEAGGAGPQARRPTALIGLPRRDPFSRAARTSIVVLTALALALVIHVVVVSGVQHEVAQTRAFAKLRDELAKGTAPVAEVSASGHGLPLGEPVAILEIPSAHVHEVVLEGTTSGVLMSGPGLRRATPFPGHIGTTVILGRRAAYGGPFKGLRGLRVGAKITLTTGQGVSTYSVIGRRSAGDPAPPPPAESNGRLLLMTAAGTPFMPSGVLRVDADLTTPIFDTTSTVAGAVPKPEQPLGTDQSTVWALVLWLQLLVFVAIGAVWSWMRWGRSQTWIVFLPLLLLTGLAASGQFMRLLPNVL